MTTNDLAKKTASGVFWNALSFLSGKGLVVITTGILARLLTRSEMGIVGMAVEVTTILTILTDLGLGAALIQRKVADEKAINTVFTLNIIMGVILGLATVVGAPLAAAFYRAPEVTPLLRVLSVTFLLNGFGATHIVMLRKELDFRRKLVPDLGRSLIKGGVAIVLALNGAGAWALIWGNVIGMAAGVILSWVVLDLRPRIGLDRATSGSMLSFGIAVLGIDLLGVIIDKFDYLVVGRQFGDESFAVYQLAYKLPEMLIITVLWVLGGVFFPTYSKVQDNPGELKKVFLSTVRYTSLLVMPAGLGLIIAADPIIRVAWGLRYLDAIPILRLLALYALILSVGYHVGGIYKAIGRPDISVKISIGTVVMLVPALLFGAQFGLAGVAIAHVVVAVFRAIIRMVIATSFVGFTLGDILEEMRPSLIAGAALALFALPVLYLTQTWVAFPRLLVVTAAGGLGYLGMLWLTERDTLMQAAEMIGMRLLKKKAKPVQTT